MYKVCRVSWVRRSVGPFALKFMIKIISSSIRWKNIFSTLWVLSWGKLVILEFERIITWIPFSFQISRALSITAVKHLKWFIPFLTENFEFRLIRCSWKFQLLFLELAFALSSLFCKTISNTVDQHISLYYFSSLPVINTCSTGQSSRYPLFSFCTSFTRERFSAICSYLRHNSLSHISISLQYFSH